MASTGLKARAKGGIFFMLLLLLLPLQLHAQWGRTQQQHPVIVTAAEFDPASGKAGDKLTLALTVTVSAVGGKEYHIYGMVQPPAEGPGPIPTEVQLDDAAEELLVPRGEWIEPETVLKYDEGFERDVNMIYGSPLKFTRSYAIAPGTEPGEYTIEGHLYVQACTDVSCLPPERRPFAAKLTVLEGGLSAEQELPSIVTNTPAIVAVPPVPVPAVDSVSEQLAGQSFGRFLLASFLFGIIALATPCVFPMIPITVSFFTAKSKNSPGQAALNAGVYVLSIIAGFALIGFGISVLIWAFGGGVASSGFANRLAADPYINLGFALLYIVFALALFEIFHIKLPDSIANHLNQSSVGRTDFVGIAMKAMVFVLISFTCTAPLIGVLIVQTLSGEWTRPFFGMVAFATGFALPFFVLAMAPQMMGSLPKAGSWMYSVKIVMGLLVLAAAFKFISNADIVWLKEDMILSRELLLAVWATLCGVTALYLFGLVRLKDEGASSGIGMGRFLIGTGFATIALYLAGGIFGARMHLWVDAYLPPDLTPQVQTANASPNAGAEAALTWYDNVDEAMQVAQREGKPLFIDFTGYSCTNCRLMERRMFPRPEVLSRLQQFVRVKLYTDDREVGHIHRDYQATTFGTVTLPFYAVLSPEGDVLATAEYMTDVERYVRFLDRGLRAEVVAAR